MKNKLSALVSALAFGLAFCLLSGVVTAEVPSGEEILHNIDRNMISEQAVSTSTMIIHGRTGDRTIRSKAWLKDNDKAFVEYLSPAREKGKKMLKLGDKIWNYTPEPHDRIITISGHLLRQSVMGSDLSYEDMTDNDKLLDLYDARVESEEAIGDRQCYVVRLTAKTKGVTYHSRKVWVDSERWLPLKEERFARSGKLLKTTEIESVFRIDDRWYPKRMTFKDMLSRGKGTEYIIEAIEFDVLIPDHLLTKAALRQ
jgi:outer membrane lipoprotein-sorting protein